MEDALVVARLEACERSVTHLRRVIGAMAGAAALALGVAVTAFTVGPPSPRTIVSDTVRTRSLIVTDGAGVSRVIIGAPLPNPVVNGKLVSRGDEADGIVLNDAAGRERSGYVTFAKYGVVALTLDTRSTQAAMFAADSMDGAVARLWRGADWVEMKADQGGPHLSAGRDNGVAFFMPSPTGAEAARACGEFKEEGARATPPLSTATLLAFCKKHRPDGECRRCVGLP